MQGDIGSPAGRQKILQIIESIGRLDALVNNASLYFPTPIGEVTERDWKALFDSNLAGPFFLSQSLAPFLAKSGGSIVNVADRSARQAQKGYSAYSIAKGGNLSMTRALALELAPAVRVNSVAPGVILWPENDAALSADVKNKIVAEIPLGRLGDPKEIAETVFFLATSAHYMTGQTIAVDGGLSNCF